MQKWKSILFIYERIPCELSDVKCIDLLSWPYLNQNKGFTIQPIHTEHKNQKATPRVKFYDTLNVLFLKFKTLAKI